MKNLNFFNLLSLWTNGRTTQQRLTQTEEALRHSETLRRELQDEIDLRKQVQLALHSTTNVLARRTTELQAHTTELEKRNQELDAFAHTVAHDLKNPLAGIVTMTGLLVEICAKGTPLDAKCVERLQMVNRAGQQTLNTIDALLLLAGLSRQRQVKTHLVNMSQVVTEVIQQRLADMIENYHATLILPPSWPSVEGYAPWLSEVWMNYLSNALKYGGQPPQLKLGYQVREEMIRFWVHDNGMGLTAIQQAKLFTPFTRLHQKRAEGHGLGLSIVRQIVEKLGGQVGVISTLGQGSCFYFELLGPQISVSHAVYNSHMSHWALQTSG
jgi:two-component system, sensor histidine kinase and response regulator